MKYDTIDQYPAESADLTQRALLTIWDCLSSYHDDLVLIGGLAVRYLTKPPTKGIAGAVTMDVDFAIHFGASNNMYGNIRDTLGGHGFTWEKNRFAKKFPEMTLYVDLLTDDGSDKSTIIVDDGIPVSVIPGVDRALLHYRNIEISGKTLVGSQQKQNIKVAEVGPLLVLKLNAFEGRKAPKDAHDILHLAMNYLDGTHKAITDFKKEKAGKNRGMKRALECLEKHFSDPESEGALACAHFRLGAQHRTNFADDSLQIRQQCVTLAKEMISI